MSEASHQLAKEHALALRLEALADDLFAGKIDLVSDYQRLAFAFASKSAKTYRGILRLIEHGLGEPALILVRVIFEDLVNLKYIGTDPDRLAPLFLDFHILEKRKYIDYWEEAGLGDDEVVELKAVWERQFKAEYERVLANYPKRTYWSGKNLKEMAAAVDPQLTRTYCMLYPYISGFAHGGSPLALASYIDQTNGAAITSLAAPSDAELSEALVAGFGLFLRCLKIFSSVCRLDPSAVDALAEEGDALYAPPV